MGCCSSSSKKNSQGLNNDVARPAKTHNPMEPIHQGQQKSTQPPKNPDQNSGCVGSPIDNLSKVCSNGQQQGQGKTGLSHKEYQITMIEKSKHLKDVMEEYHNHPTPENREVLKAQLQDLVNTREIQTKA